MRETLRVERGQNRAKSGCTVEQMAEQALPLARCSE